MNALSVLFGQNCGFFFQCVQGHFLAMQDVPLSVEFGPNIKNVFF